MATLEINYNNLRENAKQLLKSGKQIIAVVKNNAYNMDLVDSIKAFYSVGIDYFATTNIKEAILIRETLGQEVNIFLLNATTEFNVVKKYNIEINIPSLKYLQGNYNNLNDIKLHLEFAGSMRRAGARNTKEVLEIIDFCKENKLKLKAFWSHFAFADEFDGNYEKEKEVLFDTYTKAKQVYNFEVVHFQNSASYFRDDVFEEVTHIRPGILLYGAYPYNIKNNDYKIKYFVPYHSFKVIAEIVNIVNLKQGECIGYSNSFVAGNDINVAVVGIGYGDGILRSRLTGKTCLVNDKEYKILSTMMSHIVIEIDENVAIGDEVIIYSEKLPMYNYTKYCGANSEQMAVLNKNSLEVKKVGI